MGVNLSSLVQKKEIRFEDLRGKVVAIDAYNILYQFITTIRQIDGTPLMDKQGRVTSHLSGLFYRFTNLLKSKVKPLFVFDGKPPKLKHAEMSVREERKRAAKKKYEKARKHKVIEEMGKYAKQFTKLSDEAIEESKNLLEAMGLPYVQAPSEGEAQAAFICKRGDAYAVVSQDFDSLLFGSPLLVQNLTMATKRRLASGAYVEVRPEIISIKDTLKQLKLTQEQLITLGILVGTDYNPGGYKGIGPKKALELVKEHKNPDKIFSEAEQLAQANIEFNPQEILKLFREIPVTTKYSRKFGKLSEKKVRKILCKKHDFSETRVDNALERLKKAREQAKQVTLEGF